ncbi:DNA methyltransferase [Oerskovia sp. NPDC056781]|uniref:DNA methyltransferase n=1 Tax=Oerskovia sp. NPDC056781 TaxID=3345942 RepID=UPI00366BFE04
MPPQSQSITKLPSWNEIRQNAREFAHRWAGESSEQAEAQTFWNEFLAVFGVDRRRVALFERHVKRTSTGKDGRIDLYWPGVLVVEHKSADKPLDAAEAQAIDYLDDLEQENIPQVVITSDFKRIRILDMREVGAQPVTIYLHDLEREIDRFMFIAGYEQRKFSDEQESLANISAAKLMGELYAELEQDGYPDHDASVLLARLLFLMFGDDTGMWSKGLFLELLETRTSRDGSDLGAQLAALFSILDTPENRRPRHADELMIRFPYVNGHLFSEQVRFPFFNRSMRSKLLEAAAFDWSKISPAVFGSMFQSVKDRTARRTMGEHYTTEKNIMRVVQPLFLDELRARFDVIRNDARRLREFKKQLGTWRFLDPACGCGNFLIIAYRELRRLELEVMIRLRDLRVEAATTPGQRFQQDVIDPSTMLDVTMDQFVGIEIEEWPAMIAETAMFLVDHQENIRLAEEFGVMPDRLPIEISTKIARKNALRVDWRAVAGLAAGQSADNLIILGNPPFIGMNRMTAAQQEDRTHVFESVDARDLRTGRLDYVACWYARAIAMLQGSKGRAAFVSTNSLTQGEQARTFVPLFDRYGFKVDFGHRTFLWTSEAPEAASVMVVIIGFSAVDRASRKQLFDYPHAKGDPVETQPGRINFYLVDAADLAPVKLSRPMVDGMPLASKGSQPTDGRGGLLVTVDQYAELAHDTIASKYLRRFYQGDELLGNVQPRWCLWLVDAPPSDLRGSRLLRDRLRQVKKARLESPTLSVQQQADTPALFTQIRQPEGRYIALPEVSSENREWIPGRFFGPDDIAGNKLIVWNTHELWHFGYLQSSMFMAWIRTYAGRLKSDFSISPGLMYFPFPFVVPNVAQQARIEVAVRGILDEREAIGETLAAMYDPLAMPRGLRRRHQALDAEIDGLYGLSRPTEADRMKAIVKRYELLLQGLPTKVRNAARIVSDAV